MGNLLGKSGMACIAAISLFALSGCVNSPASLPESKPVAMYVEQTSDQGTVYGLVNENGTFTCDEGLGLTAELVLGGTVKLGDETVSADVDKSGNVLVTAKPFNEYSYSGVVNGDKPFVIPDAAKGEGDGRSNKLSFATADFGSIESIVLCGGGA